MVQHVQHGVLYFKLCLAFRTLNCVHWRLSNDLPLLLFRIHGNSRRGYEGQDSITCFSNTTSYSSGNNTARGLENMALYNTLLFVIRPRFHLGNVNILILLGSCNHLNVNRVIKVCCGQLKLIAPCSYCVVQSLCEVF